MHQIYVMSDIHGQYDLYTKALDTIHFDDTDTLYILGDLIDRGPDGIKILQDVIWRPNVHCCIGNHELFMHDNLWEPKMEGEWWLSGGNGGTITRDSYLNLSCEEQAEIRKYVENMYAQIELTIKDKSFLLSHSFFTKRYGTIKWKDLGWYETYDIVWYSPYRRHERVMPSLYQDDGRIHIIGHYPVQGIPEYHWQNEEKPKMPRAFVNHEFNIIDIDTGCARMSFPEYDRKQLALCVLNLTQFVEHEEEAFLYIQE